MPIFIKFEGGSPKIRGDVKKGAHAGWLTLESAQFGVSRNIGTPGNSTERGTGAPHFSEIVGTFGMNEATNDILSASLTGEGYSLVTIDFVKDGEDTPYMQVKLKSAMVTTFSSSGGDKPMVSFALNYLGIEYGKTTPPGGKSAALMQFDLDQATA
ncbi:MAG: type VI secretion system tube protein Hcp [Acidobacteriota bacterium]